MIEKIGVIGAGLMGSGIAQVFTAAGYEVYLSDVSEAVLKKSLENIQHNLEKKASRNRMLIKDLETTMTRLHPITGYKAFKECEFVIEAVNEDEELKRGVFRELVPHLSSKCLLATNTSSISVTSLASTTDRPDKFMGMHFMNPVPVIPLVELIKGMETSNSTFKIVNDLVKTLEKQSVVSEDYPGFIINRILMPMINEAVHTLFEGVGTTESIDKAMQIGTNQPMGPLELADLIGLDTCVSIMNVLYKGFGRNKYKPCPLLVKYVEAGWLGRKSGRGFYNYEGESPVPLR